MIRPLALALLLTGCGAPSTGDDMEISNDLAMLDMSAPDLTARDFALPPDLTPRDLAMPDLAMPDLVPGPDLYTPPDLRLCNMLADGSPGATEMMVAQAQPQPVGGAVADGTYFLTALTHYTGPQGMMGPGNFKLFQTLVLTAGSYQTVSHDGNNPELNVNGTYKFDTNTKQFSVTPLCPTATGTDTYAYDSIMLKTLTLYIPVNQGMEILALTFTRQ
jgi:hypothetical protein